MKLDKRAVHYNVDIVQTADDFFFVKNSECTINSESALYV